MLALAFLFIGFGGWVAFADLSAATIATGHLGHSHHNREVQHPIGGLVRKLFVAEGAKVAQGDILFQLDDTRVQSELTILNTRIIEIATRQDRLIAERDGLAEIEFSKFLRETAETDPKISMALAGQSRLYAARRQSWFQEQGALRHRAQQIGFLAHGITAQINAYSEQTSLLSTQLRDAELLRANGLVPVTKILILKQEIAALGGKTGAALSKRAEALAKIAETELEILRIISQNREAAIEQLRDLEFRRHELLNQRRAVQIQIDALTLRSPIDGIILGLGSMSEHTVVEPGKILMRIVPQNRSYTIEARVSPTQISKIFPGQAVRLAFPDRADVYMAELTGTVGHIAADTQIDAVSGNLYFQVMVVPTRQTAAQLIAKPDIIAGMPVELYFNTGNQPAWQYLAKPFLKFFLKALREN